MTFFSSEDEKIRKKYMVNKTLLIIKDPVKLSLHTFKMNQTEPHLSEGVNCH